MMSFFFFFFKQKTAYEMRISDWSSDVCSSDLIFEDGVFSAGRIARIFDAAIADPKIRAILFRVDSPGGSYVASDTVWNQVRRARAAGKPVVVSMGGAAASGGYRSEEHRSELQSLIGPSYAVFCLKKKKTEQARQELIIPI